MRFRLLAAVAALLFTTGLTPAQQNTGPTVEVRLRSVNDLVDKFEYVAGLAGKEDAVRQVRELIKVLSADGKGIEGIDPKKPIGAYVTLAKEIETSPFVVMLPIADEEQFLKALKTRLDVTPEKGDDGTQKIAVPIVNELHIRFTNGYLYVSQKAKDLDAKKLLTPKAYFAKDDGSVLSVLVYLDRIPADLRTFVLGQFELGVNEERKKNAGNESAAEKQLKNLVFDSIIGGVKGIADDGKELSVKLFVDAKTDELSAEVSLSAKNGSATAKNFASLGSKTSVPAAIVAAVGGSAVRGNVKVAITEGMKKEYATAIDGLLAELVKKAPPDQEEVAKSVVEAIAPSLKGGELDLAAGLLGPDSKGRYQMVAAVGVKDGKGIEKLVKDLVKQYGQFIENDVTFKFDVETVGDFNLHRIDFTKTDDKFEKLFGTKTVWLATSDKYLAWSIEADGAAIRKGLKGKAVPVPVVNVEVAAAKLLPIIQPDLKPDELKAILKDAFDGNPTGKDTINVTIEGGEKLTLKLKAKGKVLRLGVGLDLLKGR